MPDERGLLMEMLRSDDPDFQKFGAGLHHDGLSGRGEGLVLPQEADRPLRVRRRHPVPGGDLPLTRASMRDLYAKWERQLPDEPRTSVFLR